MDTFHPETFQKMFDQQLLEHLQKSATSIDDINLKAEAFASKHLETLSNRTAREIHKAMCTIMPSMLTDNRRVAPLTLIICELPAAAWAQKKGATGRYSYQCGSVGHAQITPHSLRHSDVPSFRFHNILTTSTHSQPAIPGQQAIPADASVLGGQCTQLFKSP
jgi:hypothetical protein